MEFKTFELIDSLNGHELKIKVRVIVDEDYDTDIEDQFDFGDAVENAAYLAMFKSNQLFSACISVVATCEGFEGSDILGACHIHTNNFFDSSAFENDVNIIVNENGMVANAVNELKRTIRTEASRLQKYAHTA